MQVGIFQHDNNKSKTKEFLYITIFCKLQIYSILFGVKLKNYKRISISYNL